MPNTTTEVGRIKLLHPDLGYDGGSPLHALVRNAWTKLGDSIDSRFFTADALGDGSSVDLEHNFKTDFTELRINLYERDTVTGELTKIVSEGAPDFDDFTIVATPGSLTTQVRVTNNTGSAQDIAVVIAHTGKEIDGGLATNASRLIVPKNTTANLAALARKEAALLYNQETGKLNVDDGLELKVVGGGLIPTAYSYADAATPLEAGKVYTIDLDGSGDDTTFTLPTFANEDQMLCLVRGNKATAYRAIFATAGGQVILYNGSEGDSIRVVDGETWIGFVYDNTASKIIAYDAKVPLSGTFGGDLEVTGDFTPSGGIVGKTDGVAVAAGYVGDSGVITGSTGAGDVGGGGAIVVTGNLPVGTFLVSAVVTCLTHAAGATGFSSRLDIKGASGTVTGDTILYASQDGTVGVGATVTFASRVVNIASADANKSVEVRCFASGNTQTGYGVIRYIRIA
jgi:hypothetical protein